MEIKILFKIYTFFMKEIWQHLKIS